MVFWSLKPALRAFAGSTPGVSAPDVAAVGEGRAPHEQPAFHPGEIARKEPFGHLYIIKFIKLQVQ